MPLNQLDIFKLIIHAAPVELEDWEIALVVDALNGKEANQKGQVVAYRELIELGLDSPKAAYALLTLGVRK